LGCSTKNEEGIETYLVYIDIDYARDQDDKKNTSGYVFLLSSRAVSLSLKK
jgi:hypothetical protein